MTSGDYSIVTEGLRKSYRTVQVLEGVDLNVQRGTLLALLGPNGAGKTTIVRILSTLLAADGGTARVHGYDVAKQPSRVREVIGLTGQNVAVDRLLTGRENLVMMGRLFLLGRAAARTRADDLLERFDLVAAANRPVRTYSGGMRRRLDLAISLITSPPVMFLDEPTTGLDPRSRSTMWETIRGLLSNGTTILLTTQYLEEADKLADRIAVLDRGGIIAEGTASELKQRVGQERLELAFGHDEAFRRAGEVIDDETVHRDAGERRISVAVTGAKHVKRLLEQVEQAGIEVGSLSLSEPTLDDVFLTLTGRPTAGGGDAISDG
jgi:ABC-2 type transport system ATP-binding protein